MGNGGGRNRRGELCRGSVETWGGEEIRLREDGEEKKERITQRTGEIGGGNL